MGKGKGKRKGVGKGKGTRKGKGLGTRKGKGSTARKSQKKLSPILEGIEDKKLSPILEEVQENSPHLYGIIDDDSLSTITGYEPVRVDDNHINSSIKNQCDIDYALIKKISGDYVASQNHLLQEQHLLNKKQQKLTQMVYDDLIGALNKSYHSTGGKIRGNKK